jgi:hypothetical protein
VPIAARRPVAAAASLFVLGACALAGATSASAADASPFTAARGDAPVVLTGAQLPQWSRTSAVGVAYPTSTASFDGVRSAHNGTVIVPPDARTGVNTDDVTAWRYVDGTWKQIRVQVDQRFPYFLANAHSDFGVYSGTDQELTYAWAPDGHATGEEAWKKIFGECEARYAAPASDAVNRAKDLAYLASPAGQASFSPAKAPATVETIEDYTKAMQDPVATLDDDDEIVFQAGDAGAMAPLNAPTPVGTTGSGQTVTIADPTNPGAVGFVYLFLKPGDRAFTAANGYVQMTRDANADEWIDQYSYADASSEKVGSSNGGYGPNLQGTVCRTATNLADNNRKYADGVARPSSDRVPRDGITVTTDRYQLKATGRWMVRGYKVATPTGGYGNDLIDRWKGRAFQQSPDSSVSVVGFEDEQVNWEANGALLGWRQGPVRAIREIWGADSGTNVTKTETYYRNADTYRYRVRVHPIPPDGLYTSWDYNKDVAATYYNTVKTAGVPIDGRNDDTGSIDEVPVSGQPAFIDTPDPTFDLVSAVNRPEEVAGKNDNGALVYVFEFKGGTSLENADAVPYYRDDACLDDGTGDDPIARPWPGEAMDDSRVSKAYLDLAKSKGAPLTLTMDQLKAECQKYETAAPWARAPFQGAYASHGIHFFVTHDSDNAQQPVTVNEIDGQQWRYAVSLSAPANVIGGDLTKPNYALNVITPLQASVLPYGEVAPTANVPEVPMTLLLPFVAIAVIGGTTWMRRRQAAA